MILPFAPFEPNIVIQTFSLEALGDSLNLLGGSANSNSAYGGTTAAWPAANRALFIPFTLSQPIAVAAMFTYNGGTASGNLDLGIYSEDGTRILSTGSTAMSGTSTLQVISVTSTVIGPGRMYLAMAVDNTTAIFRAANTGYITAIAFKVAGMAQMASAFALPATATLATLSTSYAPIFGLSTKTGI